MLPFMFRFMFANICFEKNQNSLVTYFLHNCGKFVLSAVTKSQILSVFTKFQSFAMAMLQEVKILFVFAILDMLEMVYYVDLIQILMDSLMWTLNVLNHPVK